MKSWHFNNPWMSSRRGEAQRWAEDKIKLVKLAESIAGVVPGTHKLVKTPSGRVHSVKDLDRVGQELGYSEKLSEKFRRKARELLLDEEIQKRIRARIELELADLEHHPTLTVALVRVGAGHMGPGMGQKGPAAPLVNLDLRGKTEEELRELVNGGVKPALKKQLKAGGTD